MLSLWDSPWVLEFGSGGVVPNLWTHGDPQILCAGSGTQSQFAGPGWGGAGPQGLILVGGGLGESGARPLGPNISAW